MDRWFAEFRASGDPRPLARVFDRAAPELWRVAGHLCRDRHAAEDAVQAAFLAAIEARNDWDPARPLMPWLLGLLANRVREERRRLSRRPQPERLSMPGGEPDPADTAAARELDGALLAALAKVAEPYRATLEQHLVHGLPASEIAARDGMAAGTVRMRLHRGLEQLRRRLPKGVVAGGTGALVLTPESMAAMRSKVLAGAGSAASIAGAAAGAAAATAWNGRWAMLAIAALSTVALVPFVLTRTWGEAGWRAPTPIAAAVEREHAPFARDAGAAPLPPEPDQSRRQALAGPTGELRIRVLDRATMAPMPGVRVVAQTVPAAQPTSPQGADDRHECATGADGAAAFTLPAGTTRVEVLAPGGEAATVVVPAGGRIEQALLVAARLAADVEVLDATGAPVVGARIVGRLAGVDASADAILGETGSDGRWRGPLPFGQHVVRATAEGRARSEAALLSRERTDATLRVGGAPGAVLGTVRDEHGRPVAGASVALQRAPDDTPSSVDACSVTRADAEGCYEVDELAAGAWIVYAWQGKGDERRFASTAVEARAGGRVVADVTFGRDASIAIELTRPDGRPWSGSHCTATAEQQPALGILIGRSGRTDARGRLRIDALPPGRYRLTATVDDHETVETVDLGAGAELAFRRVLGDSAWIEVQLTDPEGRPLAGFHVRRCDRAAVALEHDALWPRGPETRTDDDGVARFEGQPDAPAWIVVDRADTNVPIAVREVPTGRRTTIGLSRAELAQRIVRGRIARAGEGQVGMRTAILRSVPAAAEAPQLLFGGSMSTPVGPDGSFAFHDVPAGTYVLVVTARGAAGPIAWRRDITVRPEHDVDLGPVASGIGNLACRLLRRDGRAVGNPRLVLRSAPGHPFQSWRQAASSSVVELQDLPAGTCDLLALGDDCAPAPAHAMTPDPSGRGLSIAVEPAATVTVRCEHLPPESRRGELRVHREGRPWFGEVVRDAREPYRCGLPPGEYRVEFLPDDATRGPRWIAAFTVGGAPVEVVARRVDQRR